LCCALKLRKEDIIARHHSRIKILSIFGTRPEAIKMAPLVKALAAEPGIHSQICITGQHQSMLKQVLDLFDLKADYTLDVMTPHQSLNSLTAALYGAIDPVLEITRPDRVLVHGDTMGPVTEQLGDLPNAHLIKPLDYLAFVRLMQRAHVILTDSGGVQEEAPSLGKPVLVMRDVTECPEAVAAGTVRLVGTSPDSIIAGVNALFDDDLLWRRCSQAANPYGDGKASARIVDALMGRPVDDFVVTGVRLPKFQHHLSGLPVPEKSLPAFTSL
jgi:UDP-N-acetylglucosamine 2-epimerase